ncbi:hypothetical protein [Nocardia sp. MW-W600-9]
MSVPSTDLDTHLTRIQHWSVSAFGGDAVAPAADIDPIVVHGEWSNRLPADLVAVFTRLGEPQLIHLPAHDLLTAGRAREVWAMWLDIIADQRARIPEYAAEYDPVVFSADPAGTPCELFLPSYLPIADRDGSTLFVDTRVGELSGCVGEYSATGAAERVLWNSLSEMFEALAESLDNGTPFLGATPLLRGGALVWERDRRGG